jgi:hypothetical protein
MIMRWRRPGSWILRCNELYKQYCVGHRLASVQLSACISSPPFPMQWKSLCSACDGAALELCNCDARCPWIKLCLPPCGRAKSCRERLGSRHSNCDARCPWIKLCFPRVVAPKAAASDLGRATYSIWRDSTKPTSPLVPHASQLVRLKY